MTTKKYRIDVNIVDDHTMLAESLAEAISRTDVARVSRTFTTLEACRQTLYERCPDVLLLDISMPDGSGMDFCRQMIAANPRLKIICVTIHDEYSIIRRMLDSGVHGYLLKSSPVSEVVEAIQTVWRGGSYVSREVSDIISRSASESVFLTSVEQSILRLICNGNTNPQIASQLNLSTETVNWYRKRLLAKFDVKNTVGLVTLAIRQQLV